MSIKKTTRRVALMLFVSVSISATLFGISRAQSPQMTDEQIARIRTNCVSAKSTLNQLHASDGLLRVNRGQLYLSITTKLMAPFDNRVSSNHFDAKDLLSATNNYTAALETFSNDYIQYEQQLSSTLRIDCSKEPVAFYDAVNVSRAKRAQVHADVTQLHTYIDEYKAHFDTFSTHFASDQGGSQ